MKTTNKIDIVMSGNVTMCPITALTSVKGTSVKQLDKTKKS